MDTIKTFLTTKDIYRAPVSILVTGVTLLVLGIIVGIPSMAIAGFTDITVFAMVSGYCIILPLVGIPLTLVGLFASLGAVIIDSVRIDRAFWARYPRT